MKYSILMSIYNNVELFAASIESLLGQDCQDWELLIWDNSDKTQEAWNIIEQYEKRDQRIHGYRDGNSYGWSKAASILLDKAQGDYVTFLASDDFMTPYALDEVSRVITESPDVVIVGFEQVYYDDKNGTISSLGVNVPEYKEYNVDNKSRRIVEIMNSTYYNSFFHYLRREFLFKVGIDFFDNYKADCAAMTRAIAEANSLVVLNKSVYLLTDNTSQTKGCYTWNLYEDFFANQWRSVRKIFLEEKYQQRADIQYVAMRILRNLAGNIKLLAEGRCRDVYMNPINVTPKEIVKELNDILNNEAIQDMIEVTGEKGAKLVLDAVNTFDFKSVSI